MTHLESELLHDHIDGRLDPAQERRVADHLATCAQCRDDVQALRDLVSRAAGLAPSVPVPEELWSDVRATIGGRQVRPIGPPSVGRWSPRLLVAAATALVVVSSGTTAYLMRDSSPRPGLDPGPGVVQRPTPDVVASQHAGAPAVSRALPASWQATEAGYLESVASLRAQLDAQRDALDPATVAAVERSLATIDSAIAEARDALLRDPANAAVSDLLASNYRQKVELLRRATQLTSST